ncbi:MAG: hypothetical protein MUF54_01065 [Polyangiaceae bacterium]|jgi:hypothetical protein|nr:hypothetical protein [Polyangiaceae bacterium]
MHSRAKQQRSFSRPARGILPAFLGTLAASGLASTASADDKAACLESYVEAQRLKKDSSYIAARDKLIVCSHDACPAAIRSECVQWLAEVDRALPSVVVLAKDHDGHDIVDVRVTVDGEPFLERAEGKAIPIDPGVRTFRFEASGFQTQERQVVVRASVQDRVIAVALTRQTAAGPAPPAASDAPTTADPAADSSPSRAVPAPAYVLGGVGVVGLAGFGAFAWRFSGQRSDLEGCKPFCSQTDIDAADRSRKVAFVSLGVGVVALGAATVLYATRPEVRDDSRVAAGGLVFDVGPTGAGGAAATLSGTF